MKALKKLKACLCTSAQEEKLPLFQIPSLGCRRGMDVIAKVLLLPTTSGHVKRMSPPYSARYLHQEDLRNTVESWPEHEQASGHAASQQEPLKCKVYSIATASCMQEYHCELSFNDERGVACD